MTGYFILQIEATLPYPYSFVHMNDSNVPANAMCCSIGRYRRVSIWAKCGEKSYDLALKSAFWGFTPSLFLYVLSPSPVMQRCNAGFRLEELAHEAAVGEFQAVSNL